MVSASSNILRLYNYYIFVRNLVVPFVCFVFAWFVVYFSLYMFVLFVLGFNVSLILNQSYCDGHTFVIHVHVFLI